VMAGAAYMLIFGIGMMGAMTFAGYFGTFILFELDTLTSSYYTLFLVVGMMVSSMISGALCERTGYRPWLVAGPIIVFVGLYLFYLMNVGGVEASAAYPYYHIIDKPIHLYCVAQLVLGLGLGCMMTPVLAAVQNSSEPSEIGMNSSAVNLLRSVGTAVGTAIFTMLINAHYADKVDELVTADPAGLVTDKATEFVQAMIGYINVLPEVSNQVLDAFVDSVHFGFIAGGCVILAASVIGLFVRAKTTYQLAREGINRFDEQQDPEQ